MRVKQEADHLAPSDRSVRNASGETELPDVELTHGAVRNRKGRAASGQSFYNVAERREKFRFGAGAPDPVVQRKILPHDRRFEGIRDPAIFHHVTEQTDQRCGPGVGNAGGRTVAVKNPVCLFVGQADADPRGTETAQSRPVSRRIEG